MATSVSQFDTLSASGKGALACSKFDQRALEKGGVPSIPLLDARYDRILDWQGRLYRVQVKYCDRRSSHSGNAALVHLQSYGHGKCTSLGYTGDEVDAVVAYFPQVEALCWFDTEVFEGRTALTVRFEPAQNGQCIGIRHFRDYLW